MVKTTIIYFTSFIALSLACTLQINDLCPAVQNDVDRATQQFGASINVTEKCNCADAKTVCDELEKGSPYSPEAICKAAIDSFIKDDAIKQQTPCSDDTFRELYRSVRECNVEATMVVSSSSPMMPEKMMTSSYDMQMMMNTSYDMPMMATTKMMNATMNETRAIMEEATTSMMKDAVMPTSSYMQMMISSSVISNANEFKVTHAALFFTALVAILYSLL